MLLVLDRRSPDPLRWAAALFGLWLGLACASPSPGPRPDDVTRRQALAHHDLGVQYLTKGRVALAIRELRVAAEQDPRDPWIQLHLGEAYRRRGRFPEAEQHLRRALDLDPEFHQAQLNLSVLFIETQRFEEAARVAQRLVDDPAFPGPWRALTNLGWAQLQLGRRDEARRNLKLALEYHDRFLPALLDLAILEAEEEHRLEALRLLERLLAQGPGPLMAAEAHYRIAEIYISLGRRDEAVAHLTAASSARPSGEWGRRSEEYLKLLR